MSTDGNATFKVGAVTVYGYGANDNGYLGTPPTPEQIAQLRKFSIVSLFEAKRVGVKVKDCRRLVDLGLLSETGTPRRYRLTHQGYLASRITSTASAADFAA